MSYEFLANFWFLALGLVWAIYAAQETFITGGSILGILYKKEEDYKRANNILALHWDGIQVWLILAVGGMFAAFPSIYAITLSSLYIPFFLLLYAIIVRGISIEVIYKTDNLKVRKILKWCLSISSIVIILVIGVYLMNIFIGLPISDGVLNDTFFSFLVIFNPVSLLGGVTFLAFALAQGVSFIALNTEKKFVDVLYSKAKFAAVAVPVFIAGIFLSFSNVQDVFIRGYFADYVILWVFPLVCLVCAAVAAVAFWKKKYGFSFIFNIISILTLVLTGFISMLPYTLISTTDPSSSILVVDGAAGETTLLVMFVAVVIFLPIVIGYQLFKYIKFWRKI